jgi:hypothetical protein
MSDTDRPMWPFPTDDAMDDAIGAWHSRPDDAPPMTLHTWLGMSWETYAAWLKRSDLRAEAWERRGTGNGADLVNALVGAREELRERGVTVDVGAMLTEDT